MASPRSLGDSADEGAGALDRGGGQEEGSDPEQDPAEHRRFQKFHGAELHQEDVAPSTVGGRRGRLYFPGFTILVFPQLAQR